MVKLNNLFISTLLVFISIVLFTRDVSSSSVRVPRSIGGFIRRLFNGRRKQTAYQETAQLQQPYGQGSSSYPSYSQYPIYSPNYSQFSPGIGAYSSSYTPGYQNYGNYPVAASSGQFSSYAQPSYGSSAFGSSAFGSTPYGSSPYGGSGAIDVHSVLDQLIRSAGLSPQGDHDSQASSLQSKGDSYAQSGTSPVFSFKKLYSFPFFLNSDQAGASEGNFNFHVPFLKRHIKRMSALPEYETHAQMIAKPSDEEMKQKIYSQIVSHEYSPANDVEQSS